MEKKQNIFKDFFEDAFDEADIQKQIIGNNKEYYFDYASSGLAFEPIEQRIQEVLKTYANIHSGLVGDAKITANYYKTAKQNIKKFLELDDQFALLSYGAGATGAIKKFQELIGIYIPPQTRKKFNFEVMSLEVPLVIVGPFEHHTNELSYRESVCDVIRVPLNRHGNINLSFLERTLKENSHRKIIGSFSIASSVTGVLLPYKRVSKLLRKYNAIVAFDNATASPCLNIPCELYDAMFVSPHKHIGGPGSCGLLAIRRNLVIEEQPMSFSEIGTVQYVSKQEHLHHNHTDIEMCDEAGTVAILQLIKASFVFQLRNEFGLKAIQKKKVQMCKMFKDGLSMLEGCTVYGQDEENESIGIVAMNFDGVTPCELCEELANTYRIQTRVGCSCVGPYAHDLLGIKKQEKLNEEIGWLRISINYTHSEKNIQYLLDALKKSLKKIRGKENE